MIFRWMFGGIILVSLAFVLPGRTAEVWPSLNAAGIATLIYIIALLLYTLRNPIPVKHRVIVGLLAFISVIGLSAHWTGMRNTTEWQQNQLLDNKSLVVRGTMISDAPVSLLSVLEEYHAQGMMKKQSLANTFLHKYPLVKIGSNILSSVGEDSTRIFVTTLSDSAVILTASHAYARGRTADFLPYWGRKGTVQERYILTEEGVRHESDN